jgi:photosystem II stability/assembly factor-like uncharacterized protein
MKNKLEFEKKIKQLYTFIFFSLTYKLILLFIISLCFGNRWIKQESNTITHLRSIHFINQNEGWIVGNGGLVLSTKNGGDDWNKVDLAITNDLNYITFVTPDTGWIVGEGSTIFVTYNRGIKWKKVPLNLYKNLSSIYFYNSEIGWMTYGGLLKTIDGGKNWTEVESDAFNYYIGTSYAKSLRSILFLDSLTGFVSTSYSFSSSSDFFRVRSTAITHDAGKTWHENNEAGGSGISFLDSTTIISAADGWSDNFGYIEISKSIDKGKTWQIMYDVNSFSMDCPAGIERINKYILYMKFFNDSQGIFLSTHQIHNTEDGGITWETEEYPFSDSKTSNGFFISREIGWIIGSKGIIYKTTQDTIGIENNIKFEKNSRQIPFKLSLNNNYNNPVVKFLFNQSTMGTFQASVFNTLGEKIESIQYRENNNNAHVYLLPLPSLPAGTYFLVVNYKNQVKNYKFFIAR